MKVLHVITNLGRGGAEAVLFRLVCSSPPEVDHVVISMMGGGVFGPQLRDRGIVVHSLNKPRGRVTVRGIIDLWRIIRREKPDVVQTWMYHADLVGGLIARLAGIRAIVWGIRHSSLILDKTTFSTRLVIRLCAWFSHVVPAAIICCSERAAMDHQKIGYRREIFEVIANGYDVKRFSRDEEGRRRLRNDWGVYECEHLLGYVARWDPYKDHENLLAALAHLKRRQFRTRCVFVGEGMELQNAELVEIVRRHDLGKEVILVGAREDIPAIMSAIDVHVISSAGEAFPNVVAEAMACGTPCVVTDVGDAALIVGSVGWIARPRDSLDLARGIEGALAAIRTNRGGNLGEECRRRIVENFGIGKMVSHYLSVWSRVG